MIRISLSYVYNFATSVEPLVTIKPDARIGDIIFELIIAQGAIEQLLNQSVFSQSIRSSRSSGVALLEHTKNLLNSADQDRQINDWEIQRLGYLFNQFKTVLLAEMETLNANFVTQKRGYDTSTLMGFAEDIFPPDLPGKVPEAIFDIREAGKCIAFEVPTAAGYHLHRANEAIVRRYYDAVTGGKPRPKNTNLGDYLAALREHNAGDARVLAALKDLKDLHRNPLAHPDQSLETIDDAIALLNGIQNAVVYMLKEITALPVPSGEQAA